MEYTYLEAVNYCISQVGAAPVDSTNDLLPDVQDAQLRLKEASMSLQKMSWWFNKDNDVTLEVDVNNYVPVPAGTIKALSKDLWEYYSIRNNRLWRHRCSTDLFEDMDSVCVDLVSWLDWEYLPLEAQDYIRLQAAQEMILHNLEDYNKANSLEDEKRNAMLELRKADLNIKRRNIRYGPQFARTRGGVRPYRR